MKNKNEELTNLLTTAIEQVIEGLERCDVIGCEDGGLDSSGVGIEQCMSTDIIPCPYCADNRARAAELRKVVAGLCWHEWKPTGERKNTKLLGTLPEDKWECTCGKSLWTTPDTVNPQYVLKEAIRIYGCVNPDFTTPEGFFRLVEILKLVGLYHKLIIWLDEPINVLRLTKDCHDGVIKQALVLQTPELFMDAATAFLQEREK